MLDKFKKNKNICPCIDEKSKKKKKRKNSKHIKKISEWVSNKQAVLF